MRSTAPGHGVTAFGQPYSVAQEDFLEAVPLSYSAFNQGQTKCTRIDCLRNYNPRI
jgi:hypothetical protein